MKRLWKFCPSEGDLSNDECRPLREGVRWPRVISRVFDAGRNSTQAGWRLGPPRRADRSDSKRCCAPTDRTEVSPFRSGCRAVRPGHRRGVRPDPLVPWPGRSVRGKKAAPAQAPNSVRCRILAQWPPPIPAGSISKGEGSRPARGFGMAGRVRSAPQTAIHSNKYSPPPQQPMDPSVAL